MQLPLHAATELPSLPKTSLQLSVLSLSLTRQAMHGEESLDSRSHGGVGMYNLIPFRWHGDLS